METIRDLVRSAWQRRLLAAACLLAALGSAWAGGTPVTAEPFANYQHTQWTAANDVPADILGMAQTSDGWLWLATSSGLFRFDGVRFTRGPGMLARARVHDLFAAPDGNLYVSIFGGGLAVVHPDGRVEDLANSEGPVIGTISAITMDNDGTLWVAGLSVYRRVGQAWEAMDGDPVWQESDLRSLLVDATGTVWAALDTGVKRFDRAHGRFDYVDRHNGSLVQAPDGSVWVLPKKGTGALRLSAPLGRRARSPRFNPSGSRFAGIFDSGGHLWKLRCPAPVCLADAVEGAEGAAPPGANPGAALPLSGGAPRQILEDREGNIWIATERGLDRFRPGRLLQSGLAAGVNQSIAADADGHIWATDNDGGLWQLGAGQAPRRVPGPAAQIVARDHEGGILVAGARSIRRLAHGQRTEMPLPPGADGKPRDRKPFVLLDDGKIVWTATADTSLIGWSGGRWRPWTEFNLTDKLYRLVPGAPGQMWLARGGGELVFYDNGKRTHYDATAVGWITGIFPGADVLVAGDGGLGVLAGGRIRMLAAADPDALRSISGLVVTPDGDRWLNGAAGLLHVRAADWRRALAAPPADLRYELFGPGDGYPGRALIENGQPSAASADGRIVWVIGTDGVAALDTGAAYRNDVPPVPQVEGVPTPRGLSAESPVRIAPGTERFAIQFTAPVLRMPERVRFEYRLDGFDSGWQDGGTRRAAEYTRVPPGAYRFRVRAYNEDGLPGGAEAVLALRVEPTLAQTAWFRTACALLAIVLAVALYRYRVRYLTARVSERLRVKTAERERIARALHDSFLQSLQAMLMRLDAVTVRLNDRAARHEIEIIRDHANEALIEGRSHLDELRAGDPAALDEVLVRHLREVREMAGGPEFVLHVENSRRQLQDGMADEIGAIAREALRNAAAHGGASKVRVVLGYGRRALTLSVADDGRGLPDDFMRDGGRPGHWGLAGMRERAERIGGILVIDSQPGRGTAIRLAVPAKRAYLSV